MGRNPNGEPESVRYEQINAMLLNEFLKEHLRVQEYGAMLTELTSNAATQEATIAHLQKQIDVLTVGLQNVTARLELSNTRHKQFSTIVETTRTRLFLVST